MGHRGGGCIREDGGVRAKVVGLHCQGGDQIPARGGGARAAEHWVLQGWGGMVGRLCCITWSPPFAQPPPSRTPILPSGPPLLQLQRFLARPAGPARASDAPSSLDHCREPMARRALAPPVSSPSLASPRRRESPRHAGKCSPETWAGLQPGSHNLNPFIPSPLPAPLRSGLFFTSHKLSCTGKTLLELDCSLPLSFLPLNGSHLNSFASLQTPGSNITCSSPHTLARIHRAT